MRETLSDEALADHLSGAASYGVYTMDPTCDTVRYAVFDLDTYDDDALRCLCHEVEKLVAPSAFVWGVQGRHRNCLLLENSGGKGYHIWLFFDIPVSASRVRRWTRKVADAYNARCRDVEWLSSAAVKWPPLEIFPKQDSVTSCGFGNLVKLPFGRHAVSGEWSYAIDRDGWAWGVDGVLPYPVGLLPASAASGRGSALQDTAASGRGAGCTAAENGGSIAPTTFACVNRILEGAPEGTRELAAYHFALYAKGVGLPQSLAHAWAQHVNAAFKPPLDAGTVDKQVQSAYDDPRRHASCRSDWLRAFCPGSTTNRICPNYKGDTLPAEGWSRYA
jgi:hypothetical protein